MEPRRSAPPARTRPRAAAAALLLAPAALAGGGCTQGHGCDGHGDDPFDCEAGRAKANIGWSAGKKSWCCETHLEGCSGTCSQGGGCGGAGSDPFDCQAGLADWAAGWAEKKKEWCCRHFRAGCDESPPDPGANSSGSGVTASGSGGDRSSGGLGAASSSAEAADVGSASSSGGLVAASSSAEAVKPKYNCSAGTYLWERGWSADKKEFCCTAANIGCSDSASALPHHHWTLHRGRSCSGGKGGASVSDDTNPVKMDMWLQDCFETCIHTDGCEGVVVTRKLNSVGQQGSAPCYLRKGIDAQGCSEDSHNDLYVYNGQDGGSVGSSSFLGASGGRVFGTQGIETFLVLGLIALAVILLLAWWFLRRRKRQLLQDPLNE